MTGFALAAGLTATAEEQIASRSIKVAAPDDTAGNISVEDSQRQIAKPFPSPFLMGAVIMTNDAKLGLVAGVGMVVLIAVVFFRQDSTSQAGLVGTTASVATTNTPPAGESHGARSPVTATSATHIVERRAGLNHVVREGESLFSLAKHFYGDSRKYMEIFHANQRILSTPDRVAPGTVLVIPELPAPSPERPELSR
jgi:nucleoid-associated protein YgaU